MSRLEPRPEINIQPDILTAQVKRPVNRIVHIERILFASFFFIFASFKIQQHHVAENSLVKIYTEYKYFERATVS